MESIGCTTLERLREESLAAVNAAETLAALREVRTRYLGRKGLLTAGLRSLGSLSPEQRPTAGRAFNEVRHALEEALKARTRDLEEVELLLTLERERIDVTLPGRGQGRGYAHPVSCVLERIETLFGRLGFTVVEGPEIEDEYHNFEALNMPPGHPARTMHDTFYLKDGRLLRTHTSPVQIRALAAGQLPLRIIAPGRVYRRDHDPTHSPMFHQVEGLLVDRTLSFADLKGLLTGFLRAFFEAPLELRFRASYFPFTEPSAEIDMRRGDHWLEILGCGVVHPVVLRHAGVDPKHWRGLAFGMGVERLAMIYYGIDDLRWLFDNDLRFLAQCGG